MMVGGKEIEEKYETEEVEGEEVYEEGRKWESKSKRENPILRVDSIFVLFDVDTDTQSATFNLTSSYKGTVPVSIHQCLCVLGSHHTAMNSDLVQRVPVPRVPTAPHRANSATAVSSRKHVPQSILKRYSTVSNSDGLRFMYGIGN